MANNDSSTPSTITNSHYTNSSNSATTTATNNSANSSNNGINSRLNRLYNNIRGISGSLLQQYETSTCQQIFTNDYFEELVHKYSLDVNDLEQLNLNQKLEEIRNFLKNEIYKQYKLQEGAEKMRNASSDRKMINNLNLMIKESNNKIDELNQELIDLNSFIVITQSESSVVLDNLNSKKKSFAYILKNKFWLIATDWANIDVLANCSKGIF
jgi:hypothetical protein